MATVQTATLDLIDKSSKEINAINSALKKLFTTMEKHKKTSLTIKINGVAKAQRDIASIQTKLDALPKSKTIQLKVGTANFTRQLNAAKAQMDKIPATKQTGFSTKNSIIAIRKLEREMDKMRGQPKVWLEIGLKNGDAVLLKLKAITTELGKIKKGATATVKQTGKVVASSAGGTTGGGTSTTMLGFQPSGGRGSFHLLEAGLAGFQYRLMASVESAIIQGFARGVKDRDISGSRLDLQQLPEGRKAELLALAKGFAAQFPEFTEGQVRGTISEINLTTRNDDGGLSPGATEALTQQALGLARLQVLQGEDATSAIADAFEFVKAAEQSGRVTDDDGNYNKEAADTFFMTLRRGMVQGGQEITAELIRSLTKSLRVSKFTLNERGLLTAIMLAEESGSTAGVGINQAIKQLGGQGNAKFRNAYLKDLGILDTKEVVVGSVGGEAVTETRVNESQAAQLRRQDPLRWVNEVLLPALERKGVKLGADATEAEIRAALEAGIPAPPAVGGGVDPSKAAELAGDLVGRRTSIDALTSLIVRAGLNKTIDLAMSRDITDEFLAEVKGDSTVSAASEVKSQFEDVLGTVGESLESVLIPALEATADALDAFSAFIEGPNGGNAKRTGVGIASVVGGIWALNKARKAIGIGGGLAGPVLLAAGGSLQTAAAMLMNFATLGMTGMPGADGKAGKNAVNKGKSGAKGLWSGLKKVTVGALIVGGTTLAAGTVYETATRTKGALDPQEADGAERDAITNRVNVLAEELATLTRQRNLLEQGPQDDLVRALLQEIVDEKITKGAEQSTLLGRLDQLGPDPYYAALKTPETGEMDAHVLMSDILKDGDYLLAETFESGSESLQAVGPTIENAAALAGPTIGQAIAAYAPQIGNAIALAFGENVQPIAVEVGAQIESVQPDARGPRADTLAVNPF